MTIKSSFRFDRMNKLDHDFSHWQILSFVCPLKYHVTLLLSHQSYSSCKDGGYREYIMSIGHILNTLMVFPSCNSQENTIPKLLFATYLPTLQEKIQPSDSLLQLSEVENTLLAQCNRNPLSKALLLMHMARQAVTSRSHVGTERQAQLLQVCRHARVTCSF